jgi:hypothetical protein
LCCGLTPKLSANTRAAGLSCPSLLTPYAADQANTPRAQKPSYNKTGAGPNPSAGTPHRSLQVCYAAHSGGLHSGCRHPRHEKPSCRGTADREWPPSSQLFRAQRVDQLFLPRTHAGAFLPCHHGADGARRGSAASSGRGPTGLGVGLSRLSRRGSPQRRDMHSLASSQHTSTTTIAGAVMICACRADDGLRRNVEYPYHRSSPSLVEVNGAVIIVPYAARVYPHDFSGGTGVRKGAATVVPYPAPLASLSSGPKKT